jgi:hypothetical protein
VIAPVAKSGDVAQSGGADSASHGRRWTESRPSHARHRIQTSGPLIQAKWVSRERRVESAVISVVPAASATAT